MAVILGMVRLHAMLSKASDPFAGESLLDRLGVEADEACVFSIAAALQQTSGAANLVFGSVLFGPPEMAAVSWPHWSARMDAVVAQLVAGWEGAGLGLTQWRAFSEVRDGFLFARWTVPAEDVASTVASWLSELLNGRATPVQGSGSPPIITNPHAPIALVRTFPFLPSPAAPLVLAAKRPSTGFLFPLEVIPDLPTPAPNWELSGYRFTSAPMWLLGLPIADPPLRDEAFGPNATAMPGIFVGRLQRQAWFTGLRAQRQRGTFMISLGIDESRISVADLEIDLEEYASGDLASARRIHLGDLPLPTAQPEQVVTFELPMLGPGLYRQLRLFDRNGLLFDATNRFPVVEQINMAITISGTTPIAVKVGESPQATLLDRLNQADQAEAAYRDLLEAGLPGRVIDDPMRGLPLLTQLLDGAQGHLDVLDPYFGWDVADWSVLGQVQVAIRVLTGHGSYDKKGVLTKQRVVAPPAGTALKALSLAVRSWRGKSPAWHDRFYLWDGGGLSVGTSPSGLGKRVARLDRLAASEVRGWQKLFDSWWTGPSVAPI